MINMVKKNIYFFKFRRVITILSFIIIYINFNETAFSESTKLYFKDGKISESQNFENEVIIQVAKGYVYNFIDKNTVALLGSLGKKPEYLDDYIDGEHANGEIFDKKDKWINFYTKNPVRYSTADKYSGNNSLLFNFDGTATGCGLIYDFGEKTKEAYMSAWIKIVKSDDQTRFQWKCWRIKSTQDYMVTNPLTTGIIGDTWWGANPGIWGNADVQIWSDGVCLQSEKRTLVPDAFLFGTWQRIEAYYKKSEYDEINKVFKPNGVFEWRRVGRTKINAENEKIPDERIAYNYIATTHEFATKDADWHYIMVGHYYGNLYGGSTINMKIYYDDIYLNNTRARIEIGNNSSWELCTIRELQKIISIPRAANAPSVEIKINKGSLPSGVPLYLFYIHHSGSVKQLGKLFIN